MKINEFINKYLGKKLDYDGAYGAQCVDLFRQYSKDVLNIPVHTGAVEGAKDLYVNFYAMPKMAQYFIRFNHEKERKYGDVIIWNKTAANPYGHVAIYIADTPEGILVLEQDGFLQDGVKISIKSEFNILGILRRFY